MSLYKKKNPKKTYKGALPILLTVAATTRRERVARQTQALFFFEKIIFLNFFFLFARYIGVVADSAGGSRQHRRERLAREAASLRLALWC